MVETVLCYIEYNNKYLMLLRNKRKEDMNKGKWLGVGGHIEDGESMDEAVFREVYEETGLSLIQKNYRGDIHFHDGSYYELMHLYTSNLFAGKVKDCDEGTLKWIPKDSIMSLELWEGDKIFLPILMNSDDKICIHLYYNNGKLVRSDIL